MWISFVAGLAALRLFHFGNRADMRNAESDCNDWLLRMPVDSWKIAIVPIVVKTSWIALFWSIWIYVLSDLMSTDLRQPIPYIGPIVAVSAASIWIMMLMWRPFRSGPWRMAVLIPSVILLYAMCTNAFVVVMAPSDLRMSLHTKAALQFIPVVVYFFASGMAIQSVYLARTNINGIVPELSRNRDAGRAVGGDRVIEYSSKAWALAHHDWLSARLWIFKVFLIGVVPLAIAISPLPLGPMIICEFLLFGCCASAADSRIGANLQQPMQFPAYLAAKPIDTAAVAWTRLVLCVFVSSITLSYILLLFALSASWEGHREIWMKWSANRAVAIDSIDVVGVVLRWSAAIFVATFVTIIGLINSFHWVNMYGRQWLSLAVMVLVGAAVLTIIVGRRILVHAAFNVGVSANFGQ